jgi:hypothetical protein
VFRTPGSIGALPTSPWRPLPIGRVAFETLARRAPHTGPSPPGRARSPRAAPGRRHRQHRCHTPPTGRRESDRPGPDGGGPRNRSGRPADARPHRSAGVRAIRTGRSAGRRENRTDTGFAAIRLTSHGGDYLIVASPTRLRAQPARLLAHQIEALSKAGGPRCTLTQGPNGMTVSSGGNVSWLPPKGVPSGEIQTAVNTVADASGQERFHTLRIGAD